MNSDMILLRLLPTHCLRIVAISSSDD